MADDSNVLPGGNSDTVPPQQLDVSLGPELYQGILSALSEGSGIEDAIASLRADILNQLTDQGAPADFAGIAADSFIQTFQSELHSSNFDLADAADFARQAMLHTIGTYDPLGSVVDPADALLAAIASGTGVEGAVSDLVQQMAADGSLPSDTDLADVESVFLDELQASLSQGQDPQSALQTAQGAAQGSIDAMLATQVPVDNPLITALAGGENVDGALQDSINAAGGDADAFVEGLENALADGVGAENALNEAEQIAQDTALAKGDAEVELSAADKLAQTLSSGDNVDEALAGTGGGDAFADALEQALAGGSTPGDAMNQADEAQQLSDVIAQEQSVPLSPADQLAASLASGDNVDGALDAAGGGDAFVNALEQSLADGSSPDSAMADGQQASDVAHQTAADQSVPVSQADQLAASLSSGENVDQALADAGGGDAFSDELEAQLASGQSPSDAMNQAGSAQQTADNTASEQSVPSDPTATALAQGGDATQGVDMAGAVADATGTTGGDTGGATGGNTGTGETQQPVTTASNEPQEQPQEQQAQQEPSAEPQTQSQTAQSSEEAAQTPTQNADSGEPTGEGDATGGGVTETIQTAEGDGGTGTGTGDETQAGTGDGSDEPQQQQLAETTPVEGAGGEGDQTGGGGSQGGDGGDEITDADIEALQEISTAAGGNTQGGSGTGGSDTGGSKPSFQSTMEASGFSGTGFSSGSSTVGGSSTSSRTASRSSGDSDTTTGGSGTDNTFVNTAPTAVNDSATGTENEELTLTVLNNDSDPDGQSLTVSVVPLADGLGEVSVSGGAILFKPGTDFDDLDAGDQETVTITYSISDGAGGSDTATVNLLITGTNDAPVVTVADSTVTGGVTEQTDNAGVGAVDLSTTGVISFVDVDADDSLTVTSTAGKGGAATNGTLTAQVTTPAAGGTGEITWTYTVDEAVYNNLADGETATETFTVEAQDSQGAAITQDVTVTITGTNDSPTVSGTIDAGSISEDAAPFQIDLLSVAQDVDNGANLDTDSVVVTMPDTTPVIPVSLDNDTGALVLDPGQFEYLAAGETVDLTVTYNVVDEHGASVANTATVRITGANDTPEILPFGTVVTGAATESVDNAGTGAVTLTTNGAISYGDIDATDTLSVVSALPAGSEKGSLTAQVTTQSGGGVGEISWTYTADEADFNYLADGETATETFTITLQDSQGAAITQDVTVTITGTNDSPIAVADTATTSENATVIVDVRGNDTDVDDANSTLTVTAASAPAGEGTATVNSAGEILFDPGTDFDDLAVGETRDVTVSYTIADPDGSTSNSSVTITVTGTNDAPTVSGTINAGSVSEDASAVQIDLLSVAQDVDTSDDLDTASVTVTSSDSRPVVFTIDNDTGALEIDPGQFNDLAQGQSVSLTVNYNVVDGNGGSVANSATVTITGENDAPTISLSSGSVGGIGDEFNPYTSATGFQAYPAIGTFADGGYVVAWSSTGEDGSGSAIVTQRFASDGTKVGSETIVNTYTANDQMNTDLAAHPDGTYTVVWSSAYQDGSGWSAQAQRFNADGTPNGGEFQLNTVTSGDQVHPTVTALPDGGEVITWSAAGRDGSGFAVMMRVYDSNGNEVTSGPVQMNTTTAGEQYIWTEHGSPISGYSDGTFVAVWSSQGVDGSGYATVAQRFASDGTKIGGEITINTTTANDQHSPAVTVLSDGTTVVTWSSYSTDGSGWSVVQRLYDSDMNALTGETMVTADAGDQYFPDVVPLADGGYVIAWTDGSALDGSSYGVFAQEFDASGNPVGAEIQLNDYSDSEQRNVDLAAKPDGGYFAVWNSYGQDGSDWSAVVREVTPSTLASPGSVVTTGAGSNGNDSSFSYVEAANFTSFPTSEGTVQAWVKTTDTSGTLFSYAVSGSANELWVRLTGGDLEVWLNNTNLGSVDASSMLDGEWHNVALSFGSGASDTVLYLDGDPIFNLGSTNALTSGGTLILGADQDAVGGSFEASQSLTGEFDGLRVWNTALSEYEIRSTMTEELTAAGYPNLVADYSFDGSLDSNVSGAPTLTLINATEEDGGVYASGAMETAISLEGIVVSDVDDASITLTLSTSDGTLFADQGLGSATVQVNGATLVITGAPADVQAALDTATFTGANGFTGTATVTAEVDDGIAPAVSQTVEIAVVDTNTAPEIAGVTADSALSLDGSETSKVEIADVDGFSVGGNTPVSVEMWVKPDEVDGLNTIFDKSQPGTDLSTFRVHIDNGSIAVWNGANVANLGGTIVEGTWQHIAVTYDGTTLTAYVDGVETGSAAWTLGAANSDPWMIGEDSQAGRNYDGLIDDVRLWRTARSETEIQTYKDAELPDAFNEGDLVANLTFDGSDGTTVRDVSGNGNDGTLVTGASIGVGEGRFSEATTTITMEEDSIVEGTILASDADGDTLTYILSADGGHGTAVVNADGTYSYTPDAGFSGTDAFSVQVQDGNGKFTTQQISVSVVEQNHAPVISEVAGGTVADFNGTNAFVEVPKATVNGMNSGTIETWVYLDSNTQETIFSSQANGVNSMAILQVGDLFGSSDTPGQVNYKSTNSSGYLEGNTVLSTGEWHHVAVTFDATGASLYIDGTLDAQASGDFRIPTLTESQITGTYIGGWAGDGGGRYLDGQIGEFRIWDTVRTEQEIQDNLATSMDGTETGLRALYNFSTAYGDGDTVSDDSGSYDGTAHNLTSVDSTEYPVAHAAQYAYDPGSSSASVEIAHAADLDPGTGSMTVEMWFYWEGTGSVSGVQFLASKGNTANSADQGYSIFMNDDTLSVRTSAGGGDKGEMEIDLAGEGVTSGWHHIAMVIDQTGTPGVASIQGYLDGSTSGWGVPTGYGSTWDPATISASSDSLIIGNPGSGQGPGYAYPMDEVRVWDYARSESEISATMGQELNGNENGLVGYWTFNEGSGTNVVDQTDNGHDGTMSAGGTRENLVEISIANNDVYKGLLFGSDADSDHLSYQIVDGPDHGQVTLDGNTFVYDHDGTGNDSFTVEISDGTDTVTQHIDVTVV